MNVKDAILAIVKNDEKTANKVTAAYPAFALAVAKNDMSALAAMIPETITMDSLVGGSDTSGSDNSDTNTKVTRTRRKPADDDAPADKKATRRVSKKKEEPASEYDGLSPKDLYNMCKEAGLNVKPKQDASVYIEAMEAAKAAADSDDDDWGYDDEEVPAQTKKASGRGKAVSAAKDDEDDDWNL